MTTVPIFGLPVSEPARLQDKSTPLSCSLAPVPSVDTSKMIFGRYTYKTVIDVVWFEIQTAQRHKFWTVQEALRAAQHRHKKSKPYIKAYSDNKIDSNGASDIFRFPIHDPENFKSIKAVMDDLDSAFHFVSPAKVISLEVAFDTYLATANKIELAHLVFDRYRFTTHTPLADWYLYRGTAEGRKYLNTLNNRRDVISLMAEGWQLTDSNSKDVECRRHDYVKTTDNSNTPLLNNQYRARDEVTLQGSALQCCNLSELERFDFTSLAPHFKYRKLSEALHPAAHYALTTNSKIQLGLPKKYRRPHKAIVGRYDGTSKFRGSTVADAGLNKEVRNQLRTLTSAWQN